MIKVHHLNNSRSQRILWLLEELGMAYQVVAHARDPATQLAPQSLSGVHPLGKSPVIEVEGGVMAETGAIVEYLLDLDGTGRLVPPRGTPEHMRCRYWLHYAEGSSMGPLTLRLVFDQVERARVNFLLRPLVRGLAAAVKKGFVDPQVSRHLDYLEGELAATLWFAGEELSIADVMMSFPLQVAEALGLLGNRPLSRAFLRRIEARPAWKRGVERGGPYEMARLG